MKTYANIRKYSILGIYHKMHTPHPQEGGIFMHVLFKYRYRLLLRYRHARFIEASLLFIAQVSSCLFYPNFEKLIHASFVHLLTFSSCTFCPNL